MSLRKIRVSRHIDTSIIIEDASYELIKLGIKEFKIKYNFYVSSFIVLDFDVNDLLRIKNRLNKWKNSLGFRISFCYQPKRKELTDKEKYARFKFKKIWGY